MKVSHSPAHAFPFFLLALALTSSVAQAQFALSSRSVRDTIPNLPDHYADRLEKFRQEPVVRGRIVFLGNSITESGSWKDLLNDSTVVNRGISGDNTFGVLGRLDEVTQRRPSKLFIMIGVNDISKDIPDEIIADNLRKILERVRRDSPDTEVYVQSILPLNPDVPGFLQHFAKENHVIRTNRLFRGVVAAAGVRFINLFPLFMDSGERMDVRLTVDGIHLNDAGYKLWVDYLRDNGYLR